MVRKNGLTLPTIIVTESEKSVIYHARFLAMVLREYETAAPVHRAHKAVEILESRDALVSALEKIGVKL